MLSASRIFACATHMFYPIDLIELTHTLYFIVRGHRYFENSTNVFKERLRNNGVITDNSIAGLNQCKAIFIFIPSRNHTSNSTKINYHHVWISQYPEHMEINSFPVKELKESFKPTIFTINK